MSVYTIKPSDDVTLTLDREQWGWVVDGLILEIARSESRKAANTASTSDIRAEECRDLILQINEACRHGLLGMAQRVTS